VSSKTPEVFVEDDESTRYVKGSFLQIRITLLTTSLKCVLPISRLFLDVLGLAKRLRYPDSDTNHACHHDESTHSLPSLSSC
jgi:hypothetical protein